MIMKSNKNYFILLYVAKISDTRKNYLQKLSTYILNYIYTKFFHISKNYLINLSTIKLLISFILLVQNICICIIIYLSLYKY